MRLIVLVILALFATGCTTAASSLETEFVEVAVPVRAPCPDDEIYDRLLAARPVPLRDQERPATDAAARVAERVQLGRYEARNGWADQAVAVIDDCRTRVPLDLPP